MCDAVITIAWFMLGLSQSTPKRHTGRPADILVTVAAIAQPGGWENVYKYMEHRQKEISDPIV